MESDFEGIVDRLGALLNEGFLTEKEYKDLLDQAEQELQTAPEPPGDIGFTEPQKMAFASVNWVFAFANWINPFSSSKNKKVKTPLNPPGEQSVSTSTEPEQIAINFKDSGEDPLYKPCHSCGKIILRQTSTCIGCGTKQLKQGNSEEPMPTKDDEPPAKNKHTALIFLGIGVLAIGALFALARGGEKGPVVESAQPTIAPVATTPPTITPPETTIFFQTTLTTSTESPAATPSTTSTAILDTETQILLSEFTWGLCDAQTTCHKVEMLQVLLDIPVDGVYGPSTLSAHLAELERLSLSVTGVPESTTVIIPSTVVPPSAGAGSTTTTTLSVTEPASRTVEFISQSSFQVVRGEEVTVRWLVSDNLPIDYTYIRPMSGGGTCDCVSFYLLDGFQGSLVSSSLSGNSWEYEATIDSTKLPLGTSDFYLATYSSDSSGEGSGRWVERPLLSVTVEPLGSPTELVGPVIGLLDVTPTEIDLSGETTIATVTIRWNITDETGVGEAAYGSGYTTAVRTLCSDSNGGAWSLKLWGSLESGSISDGVFNADWTSQVSSFGPHTGDLVCSLHFLAVDKWGNWTRTNSSEAITVRKA